MSKQKIPNTDSIEELASFWDTHDLADYNSELEEVKEQVFARSAGTAHRIALPAKEAQRLSKIARARGVRETTMLRRWIIERLHEISPSIPAGRSSRKPLPRSRQTARHTPTPTTGKALHK